MKRSLAYITAAWRGDPAVDMEQAAHYCRVVYDAGYSPICPMLYLPLFLNDAVPEEHKNGIDMGRDLLRRSRVLVVCGHSVTEAMKNDIAVAQRLGITATTLEGILTVKGQGRRWNVDYAFYKTGPDKYLLFFKSGQADAITACFSEYSRRVMKRSKSRRVPIREQLKRAAADLARQPSHKKERAREAVHEDR